MADEVANKDPNSVSSLLVANASSTGDTLLVYGDASTHSLYVYLAGGASTTTVQVVGNVASGATDSGNPVKVGGVYNTTQPTLTNGQRGDLQLDARANASMTLGTLISGEDQTNSLLATTQKPLAVTTYCPDLDTSAALEASSVTKASSGVLYGFTFSNTNAAARWIQFFNSTTVPADTTVPFLEFSIGAEGTIAESFPMGIPFSTGIAWCLSTTNGAKTVGAAEALGNVRYK